MTKEFIGLMLIPTVAIYLLWSGLRHVNKVEYLRLALGLLLFVRLIARRSRIPSHEGMGRFSCRYPGLLYIHYWAYRRISTHRSTTWKA